MAADESKLREQQARGERAKNLLADPLLVEAWETLAVNLVQHWKDSKDAEERERAWVAINILERVRDAIALHVKRGKSAAADIVRMTKERESNKE